jgi:FlaA1/EpsC-like NDP-sugar epimerase
MTDLVKAMDCEYKTIGIREGEKLHECMVTTADSGYTYEYDDMYIIYPHYDWQTENNILPGGVKVAQGFAYTSDNNKIFMTVDELKTALKLV